MHLFIVHNLFLQRVSPFMSLGTMMLFCLRYTTHRFFLLSVLECDVVAQTYVVSYRVIDGHCILEMYSLKGRVYLQYFVKVCIMEKNVPSNSVM